MKNGLILLSALLATLALAGCSQETEETTEVINEPTADTVADTAVPMPAPVADAAEPMPAPVADAAEPMPAPAEEQAATPAAAPAPAEPDDAKYEEAKAAFQKSEAVAPFFDSAYGYALFPTIGKGGFIVGGAHGKGHVYANGVKTGTSAVTQASIGLQAGGQAFSQVVFFEDKSAYDAFTRGNFEFDAQASAVVITAGAAAQASTAGSSAGAAASGDHAGSQTGGYRKGVATFTFAKGGLMAGAAIGGQKFSFDPL